MTFVSFAPAKINLFLHVSHKKENGYHALSSLVAFTHFGDLVKFTPDPTMDQFSLSVKSSIEVTHLDEPNNLILKTAHLLKEHNNHLPYGHFILEKNIPVAAGLGGGSSNAAATIRILASVCKASFTDPIFQKAACTIGADVLACLFSRTCFVHGTGENLGPSLSIPSLHLIILNPRIPLETAKVFAAFPSKKGSCPNPLAIQELSDLAGAKTMPHPCTWIFALNKTDNNLTPTAETLCPIIKNILHFLNQIVQEPKCIRMSGSGASIFVLLSSASESDRAYTKIKNNAMFSRFWMVQTTLIS